jgi:hypothetical protein
MEVTKRYRLIGGLGGELWIVDSLRTERNPLFRLRPHDERFARKFVLALNASRPRGPDAPGLTPLQRLLGEVRRVCDLADEELSARERAEFLSIVTSLVARLNAESVQRTA